MSLEERRTVSDAMLAFDLIEHNVKYPHLCEKMERHRPLHMLSHNLDVKCYFSDFAYFEPYLIDLKNHIRGLRDEIVLISKTENFNCPVSFL